MTRYYVPVTLTTEEATVARVSGARSLMEVSLTDVVRLFKQKNVKVYFVHPSHPAELSTVGQGGGDPGVQGNQW